MAEESRWWDKYYVRYFVGTVYAVPLLLALANNSAIRDLTDSLQTSQLMDAAVLAAAGLAFCYLSSAPILLLHALRARIGNSAGAFYTIGACLATLTAIALGMTVRAFFWDNGTLQIRQFSLAPYLIVVVLQAVGLATCALDGLREFYSRLAIERKSKPNDATSEYVESYRHLREHGNALLIILMENVLALALWQAADIQSLALLIVLWILPATSVWFIATWLERGLADGRAPVHNRPEV